MNCKPGDLAINVSGRPECRGEIYEVLRVYSGCLPGPAWIVMHRGEEFHCRDDVLRPIRDPGDDATDETLQWLPVPSKEVAHG